jgi:uncharacterized protein
VIFVDSNIPMYLVGAPHPNKHAAQVALETAISRRERLVTDAEVLQEILHRYVAIGRREAIQPALDVLLAVVDEVFPVDQPTVLRAKEIVLETDQLSARDAVHLAAMESYGVSTIMSFDHAFDAYPGVARRP